MTNLVHVENDNFKELIESDMPVIIDFWAGWCGPCRMMGPVFEELSQEYEGKLRFAKLDTEKHPELAGKFNIQGIPSLVMLKKSREFGRIVGFAPKTHLKKMIDDNMAKVS